MQGGGLLHAGRGSPGDASTTLFAGNPRMPDDVPLLPGVQPNEEVHAGSFRFTLDDVIYHGLNPFT
jgi:hypothetical protein